MFSLVGVTQDIRFIGGPRPDGPAVDPPPLGAIEIKLMKLATFVKCCNQLPSKK